jgi:HTH-type transcriptional regulator, transcriptional repressor of NAD biosynthesis genes
VGRTHGLTLGKFAPLHRGHQLLIETALAEVDTLSVIIYDAPQTTPVPLNVRANWIRQLYPRVRVIEAWNGPTEVGDTPEIKQKHEDYVLNELKISGITHFYSSEFYGDHMSAALGAVNRVVDQKRHQIPISGSQIRQTPYEYREYIAPLVYRDLITSVVFLGAPSTGKTTLAERMAREYNTVWMPEYGREYWEKHQVNRRLTLKQLVEIGEGHLVREDALLADARDYLFVDTNALTTCIFSQYYHGRALPRLSALAAQAAARYDLVFVCDTDIPYDDTWDRSGEANRAEMHKRVISDLIVRKIPFFVLRGDLDQRVATVRRVLARHHKYQNWVDLLSGNS